ncbi:hypothetical protein E3N88_02638 [Mikania micrantha]|uniref:3-deoxy-8-phosphooctulonate synthase n=1 Tax=Mikania micrantha TaxID=192012 RepID=A0A5N6Q4J8_9ASTR|nr:hypothetical protein E3N88_02638 [Mikania micrantha]
MAKFFTVFILLALIAVSMLQSTVSANGGRRGRFGPGSLTSSQCPGQCVRRCSKTQYHKPCMFFLSKVLCEMPFHQSIPQLSLQRSLFFDPERSRDLAVRASNMDSSNVLYKQLKEAQPFFVLAGPNVIESEEHILHMAKQIKAVTSKLGVPLVFKSSFDKANRTSSKSFRGPGLAEGLKILEKVKTTYDLPIVTDVHESNQCEAVGRVADIIQIPAFLCRQTDLLVAAAKTGKIINIKKGQFCAPSVMTNSAEKVRLAGNQNVMVCERGTMFGYNDLIVDPRNFEWMREANCPVVADVTHALQQPAGKKLEGGGVASGGLRELIPCIARTAVAVGVDGLFMEVHDDPLNAPVDGPTQWPLRHFEELLEELIAIAVSSY